MNVGLIFAGGTGTRMNSLAKPKQFLELHGKPIIIYTLEAFENHSDIDRIVVVCVEQYIGELKKYLHRYDMRKISAVIPGGDSGFASILNGLEALSGDCGDDDLVLIHDGVRPFIDEELISANIRCAKEHGNAITAIPVTEGIIISGDGFTVDDFPDRKLMYATKAPQTFRFSLIYGLYKKALAEAVSSVESAYLCRHYGVKLYMVMGSYNNIKITTPTDFYIFKAIYEAIENSQIVGY